MSLAVLNTAANVFGVIAPAKDVVETIKGIALSVQQVSIVQLSATVKVAECTVRSK